MKRLSFCLMLTLTACTPLLGSCAPISASMTTPTMTMPVTPKVPSLLDGFTPIPLAENPVRQFDAAVSVTEPNKEYRAVIKTSKGNIIVALNNQSPVAVNNFVFLAKNRFYDGTRFHRVIEGFMAQAGDPKTVDLNLSNEWGTGGPGYRFMAEVNNGLQFDRPGILAMARAARMDSQGSQFFITYGAVPHLTGNYTVFGEVISGLDVLNAIHKIQPDQYQEKPQLATETDILLGIDLWVK